MKIGVIYDICSNANYRAVLPLRALERRGHSVVWPTGRSSVPMSQLMSCDVVHCYRRTDFIDELRRLSEHGVAISYDNDDNYSVAELGDAERDVRRLRHVKEVFRDTLKIVKFADVFTTTCTSIAEQYRDAAAGPVCVIENYLQRDIPASASRPKDRGVTVGWVAGMEHERDLASVPIVAALQELLERHRELKVVSVGVRLPLRSERYEHRKLVEFTDLLKFTSRLDVGIAPLADTQMNRCRSNVKLKEYAAGGAPWLASPVGPYRGLGEKQGGRLVGDGDWVEALDELIRNRRARRRLAKRAVAWAKGQTIDDHVLPWERALTEAVARAEQRSGARLVGARSVGQRV